MLATSTDLGSKRVDSTLGNGLMNLTTAIQPLGALTVTSAKGITVNFNRLTGSLIDSGVLGSLSALQSKLSNYTAFDSYARNFTVNLSGLVASRVGTATLSPLPVNTYKGPMVVKLAGGSEFAYWQQTQELSPVANVFGGSEDSQFKQGFAMMRLADGTRLVAGAGYAHQAALFDQNALAALSLGMVDTDLQGIAQGGAMGSIGLPLGMHDRLALSWSQSAQRNPLQASLLPQANKASVGFSNAFNAQWRAGLSYTGLMAQQGFLGGAYSVPRICWACKATA